MKINELKELINGGALDSCSNIYSNTDAQKKRFLSAIDRFGEIYGADREIAVFSVPGRSEISGNHTDHNRGKVLAGAIDRDIIAIASKNDDGIVRLTSEGYNPDTVKLSDAKNPSSFEKYTSAALIGGTLAGFEERGYNIGGFDAYFTSEVLKGSGISSSAAYEVMIGNILSHLYNEGKIENSTLAKIAQHAENEYFGKPCGLMDQMACAIGGFVYIDFENPTEPVVMPIDFSLTDSGYSLCIVNTGGNHADLNDDYASVPAEMKAVAKLLGREVLRGLTEEEILKNITNLRRNVGDRAILRSLHFIRENARVERVKEALKEGKLNKFFALVCESGRSSFQYLQNVFTTINVREQGISLALALTDGFLGSSKGAYRVHGGGFAGTMQAFIKTKSVDEYVELMDGVFGDGATAVFHIRPVGACRLF